MLTLDKGNSSTSVINAQPSQRTNLNIKVLYSILLLTDASVMTQNYSNWRIYYCILAIGIGKLREFISDFANLIIERYLRY